MQSDIVPRKGKLSVTATARCTITTLFSLNSLVSSSVQLGYSIKENVLWNPGISVKYFCYVVVQMDLHYLNSCLLIQSLNAI